MYRNLQFFFLFGIKTGRGWGWWLLLNQRKFRKVVKSWTPSQFTRSPNLIWLGLSVYVEFSLFLCSSCFFFVFVTCTCNCISYMSLYHWEVYNFSNLYMTVILKVLLNIVVFLKIKFALELGFPCKLKTFKLYEY